MAGHSQFKNIMHRKGAQDAKRSKIFSMIAREIATAVKLGGADIENNPRLRLAIQNSRAHNMPKENISRAIRKGEGGDAESYDEIRYEGYGAGGVAVIVEALTDNRNRSASNIRACFAKHGGSLAETGSVSFMFDQVGEIIYPAEAGSADDMLMAAIEAGAEDVVSDDESHTVICAFTDLGSVSKGLEEALGSAESVKVIWRPQTTTTLNEDKAHTVLKLISALEDDDDVQNVYANFEIPDDVMARLSL